MNIIKKPPSVYFAHLFKPPPQPMRKTNFFFKLHFNLDKSNVTIPIPCVKFFEVMLLVVTAIFRHRILECISVNAKKKYIKY